MLNLKHFVIKKLVVIVLITLNNFNRIKWVFELRCCVWLDDSRNDDKN